MITAIFTNHDNATLTIETTEALTLWQLGTGRQFELNPGVNTHCVGSGVFKVVSEFPVHVTADTTQLYVAYTTTNSKDRGFPDPPKLWVPTVNDTILQDFFVNLRG